MNEIIKGDFVKLNQIIILFGYKEVIFVEWKDLMRSTKNVLERCWSIHHDNPCKFSVKIGDYICGEKITEETYKEILEYQQHFPYFDVELKDNKIYVRGNCKYGSWL